MVLTPFKLHSTQLKKKNLIVVKKEKLNKYLHEFSGVSGYTVGQEIKVDQCFKPGEFVDVQGKTKGHGFTGAIKR